MAPQFPSIPQQPAAVQTFGPGGMSYISNLYSGFILTAERSQTLFQFAQNSPLPFAATLTNLREAGRIGSTMNMTALQLCWRMAKLGDTAPTNQEIHDVKRYLASLNIQISVGSDETRIGEFSGVHLSSVQEFAAETVLANGNTSVGSASNQQAWVNLPQPIPFQSNVEISAKVNCNLPAVPASLVVAGSSWAFWLVFAGVKQTKG